LKESELPQVCCQCRKLKLSTLGKFKQIRGKFNRFRWVCDDCLGKEPPRLSRRDKPASFAEQKTVEALIRTGFFFQQEKPLGKFVYDFAIPALRMLIEIDGQTYHRGYGKKIKDELKDKLAIEKEWKLCRIRYSSHLEGDVEGAVLKRATELGIKNVYK
jgi:very-short-patch-repair endonuclease